MISYSILDGMPVLTESLSLMSFLEGFSFGAGAFETIRIQEGEPEFLASHLNRLQGSLDAFSAIQRPARELLSESEVRTAIKDFLTEFEPFAGSGSGVVKIIVSDGHCLMMFRPLPSNLIERTRNGVEVLEVSQQLYRSGDIALNHKLISYMKQFENLKRSVVFLNEKNCFCECPTANLFFLIDDVWITPRLDSPCLPGTIRQQLLQAGCVGGLEVREGEIFRQQLSSIKACLQTNSVYRVVPITNLLGHQTKDSIPWAKVTEDLLLSAK